MSVTRWAWSGVYENPMIRWEHGEYVLYEDHIKEMEQYKCTIDVLEQTRRDRGAACAERANAIASAHDATLRAQRLHEERTALAAERDALRAQGIALTDEACALAARVERLEALLRRARYYVVKDGRPGAFDLRDDIDAALSPQAEKLEKEPTP